MRGNLHTASAPRMRFFVRRGVAAVVSLILAMAPLHGCSEGPGDSELTGRTVVELVDWHVAGLWVINCPVAWVRVANYNQVPIKEVTVQYDTYDYDGRHLDSGRTTLSDSAAGSSVAPGQVKNFIEQYLGLIDLHSERLTLKLISVERAH